MTKTEKIYEVAVRISCICRMATRGGDYSMNACLKIANDADSVDYLDNVLNVLRDRKNFFSK